jgi:hypothetical protein
MNTAEIRKDAQDEIKGFAGYKDVHPYKTQIALCDEIDRLTAELRHVERKALEREVSLMFDVAAEKKRADGAKSVACGHCNGSVGALKMCYTCPIIDLCPENGGAENV